MTDPTGFVAMGDSAAQWNCATRVGCQVGEDGSINRVNLWGEGSNSNEQNQNQSTEKSNTSGVKPNSIANVANTNNAQTASTALENEKIDVLAKGPDGKPVFKGIGGLVSVDPSRAGPADLQPGQLQMIDGSKMMAYKNLSKNMAWDYDCHGYSVGESSYWINNDDLHDWLDHTNSLVKSTSPEIGSLVVYRDSDGKVVHSAILTEPGKVTMAAGTVIYTTPHGPSKTTTVPVADGWPEPGTTIEYWRMK
ncbi:MAG: hypothetical protein K2P84_08405 [Undibacterium sp.]|nr:hypothetical protein [Undibacterium sp.]